MPRPLRIEYAGAWYHVMNRGTNRMRIFTQNNHREIFLKLLEEISILFKVKIHSYCLMDNHYHLLLQTPFPNLNKAMRHLNGIYTQHFNRSVKRDGALFRGRYKAILIEEENYLLKVSRYIHMNPIKARIAHNLEDFKWSSYPSYVKTNNKSWLQTDVILSYFDNKQQYVEFIAEDLDSETNHFYENPKPIMANQKFIEEKINSLAINYQRETSTDINKTIKQIPIEQVCNTIANYFNIEIEILKNTSSNKRNIPRILAILAAKNHTLLTHQKIVEYFSGIAPRSLGQIIQRGRHLINSNGVAKLHYDEITKLINELYDVDL